MIRLKIVQKKDLHFTSVNFYLDFIDFENCQKENFY
jgi:hypothetical protein